MTLKSLGSGATTYKYDGADASLLERFENPMKGGSIEITAPEFTSLCPITGQPDFATIVVCYEADKWCVESKSFKMYLGSYRMHGDFHESCTQKICNDLVALLDPLWITVHGQFTPRGGIKFWPLARYSKMRSVTELAE